jgi:phage-related protein
MRFIRDFIDLLWAFMQVVAGWVSHIPGWLGPVGDWIRDRVQDIIEGLSNLTDALWNWEYWTGLIHDAIQYIMEWADVENHLADFFGLAAWTWQSFIRKIWDAVLYIIAFAAGEADRLVDYIKPALTRVWDFLGWSVEQWKFLTLATVGELVDTTDWLWDNFTKHVWGRLTAPWGPLEEWVLDRGDWVRDFVVRLPDWVGDWWEGLTELPAKLMDAVGWNILQRIGNAGQDFLLFLLGLAGDAIAAIAEPIVDLGEQILDAMWGEE